MPQGPLQQLEVFVRFLLGWLYTMFWSGLACLIALLGMPRLSWLICCRPWGRGALKIIQTQLDVVGNENLVGPAIFVSNHQSLIDVVFLPALMPKKIKWVAKKELMRVPVWGWAFGAGGAIFIDRKDPKGAMAAISEGISKLPPDWSVIVFPEGTRSRDGRLLPFKRGFLHMALRTRLPVVPIAMVGAHDVVPKGAWLVRPATVHVTVGRPINTEAWTLDTADAHVEQVVGAVQACLDKSQARRNPALAAAESSETLRQFAPG